MKKGVGSISQRYGSGDPDPKCHGYPNTAEKDGRGRESYYKIHSRT